MINITSSQEITRIYLVTNCYGDPNKVYIGKTKTNTRIFRHIRTYGEDIIFTYIDQIESLESKDWKPLECFWIEYFRFLGFDLQNKNKGGGGASFYTQESKDKMSQKRYSQEIKDKMSLATKGKPKPKDFGERISKAIKGRIPTQETRNKISNALKGIPKSEEHKLNMSKARSEEANLKSSLMKSKPVIQYDLEGKSIKEWPSIKEVYIILGIDGGNISSVCNGKSKTAGKFKWKFKY